MNEFTPTEKMEHGIPGTLSDVDIRVALAAGEIKIEPFDEALLGPAGTTYRLGKTLKIPTPGQFYNPLKNGEDSEHQIVNLEHLTRNGMEQDEWVTKFLNAERLDEIDTTTQEVVAKATLDDGFCHGFPFFPGDFALGATLEAITVGKNYKVKVDGKSSAARRGLTFHQTAMNIWPGHGLERPTTVTLELHNTGKFLWFLHYGYQAGNFVWERILSDTSMPYDRNGRYGGQGLEPGTPVSRSNDVLLPT